MSIHLRSTKSGDRRYDVRLRDPPGRTYTRTFRTRREAEAFASDEQASRRRGAWLDPRRAEATLREVAGGWLDSNPGKRPSEGTGRLGAPNPHPPCPRRHADRVAHPVEHPAVRQRLVTDAGAPVRAACVPDPGGGTQRSRARRSDRTFPLSGNPAARRRADRSAGHHPEATGRSRKSAGPRVRGHGIPGCGTRSPLGRMRRSPGGPDRLRPVDNHRR